MSSATRAETRLQVRRKIREQDPQGGGGGETARKQFHSVGHQQKKDEWNRDDGGPFLPGVRHRPASAHVLQDCQWTLNRAATLASDHSPSIEEILFTFLALCLPGTFSS